MWIWWIVSMVVLTISIIISIYIFYNSYRGSPEKKGFSLNTNDANLSRFIPGTKQEVISSLKLKLQSVENNSMLYYTELKNLQQRIRHLEKGRVVIFGAGTGNPYFTTDTAGSLRAIEIKADVILKGTRVDGIYTSDPEIDPSADKFETITFADCITKNLRVMDMTAFTLCMENELPIIVFDMDTPGTLLRVITGEKVGTLVTG